MVALFARVLTVDDLLNMPDDGKIYELHNGVLVEMAGSKPKQSVLAIWLAIQIGNFISAHKLGGVLTGADGTFALGARNTRIPDLAYLSQARWEAQDMDKFLQGAPDLAIEIVSDSNTPKEISERVSAYLDAGTRLVWVLYPKSLSVNVYRQNGDQFTVTGEGTIEGEDVLPGLVLPLATIFNPFNNE